MHTGAVVLLGGRSTRMGHSKAFIPFGNETFLSHILGQLQSFDELLLSVNGSEQELPSDYHTVVDQYAACGPMGGLHASLCACRSDALLAVSCDLPQFRAELADLLCRAFTPDVDVVLPVTADGRSHPLCAVYRKETAAVFQHFLEQGDYKLLHALQQLRVRQLSVPNHLADCLNNINTPEDLQMLLSSR